MPKKPRLRDSWTKDADYIKNFQSSAEVTEVLDLLALPGARTFLDCGCGNGEFAIRAARADSQLMVSAFDPLQTAVDECLDRGRPFLGKNLEVGIAWADRLPLRDASVDRILFRNVLHHVPEPDRVYAEFARLLKPGARLVLQAPVNFGDEEFGEFLSDLHFAMDNTHRRHYHQVDQIVAGLRKAGHRVQQQECRQYDFPFFGQGERDLITRRNLQDRLALREVEPGKWSVILRWVRLVATK